MAIIPSEKQVERNLEVSHKADELKTESQKKQGKEFENFGQGVLPEKVWKNLPGKKIEDPEAIE